MIVMDQENAFILVMDHMHALQTMRVAKSLYRRGTIPTNIWQIPPFHTHTAIVLVTVSVAYAG